MFGESSSSTVLATATQTTNQITLNFQFNVASKLFTMSMAIIRPFMSDVTLDKFRVYGNDRHEWVEALLIDISSDQLPVHYGGTMTDPDGNPQCLSKVQCPISKAPFIQTNCACTDLYGRTSAETLLPRQQTEIGSVRRSEPVLNGYPQRIEKELRIRH